MSFIASKDIKEENKNLYAAVKTVFSDILLGKGDSYFLQVDSRKHGPIDVMGRSTPIAEDETVFLRYWKCPEDAVSRIIY